MEILRRLLGLQKKVFPNGDTKVPTTRPNPGEAIPPKGSVSDAHDQAGAADSIEKKCALCGATVESGAVACPKCGKGLFESTQKVKHPETKTKATKNNAPNGVFCDLCKSRFSIDECVDPRVPEGRMITFICPTCKVPRAYDPARDTGFSKNDQKMASMDINDPTCSSCGTALSNKGSIFDGARVVSTGTKSVEDLHNDHVLFRGSVCFSCKTVFCMECNRGLSHKCPQCSGETQPAFRKHLRSLSRLL